MHVHLYYSHTNSHTVTYSTNQLHSNPFNTMQSTVRQSVRESFTEREGELLTASGVEALGTGVSGKCALVIFSSSYAR